MPMWRRFSVTIQFRWEGVSARDVFATPGLVRRKQSQREKEEIAIPRDAGLGSSQ